MKRSTPRAWVTREGSVLQKLDTEFPWESYFEGGPPAGKKRELLITAFLPLVRNIAASLKATLPASIELDDLISSGTVGLIAAVDRFDPSKGRNFSTYAAIRIKGAMLDELRMLDWAPRSVRRDSEHLAQVKKELEAKLGRTPSDEEVAGRLGLDLNRYDRLVRRIAAKRIVHFDEVTPGDRDDRRSTLNFIMDQDSPDPLEESTTKDIYKLLLQTIEGLKERHRQIITFYYFDNLSIKEIAAIFGVTESRVSQIHGEAIKVLRKRMNRLTSAGRQVAARLSRSSPRSR